MIDAKDLEVLLAKQEITEALHRYCYAMDTNDLDLGCSVWHDDGTALYEGMFEGTGHDFVVKGRGEHLAPPGSSHQLTNVLIEVDSDRATSQSCVTATVPSRDSTHFVMQGRYRDTWSRREGAWRIDHRHFALDMSYRLAGADTVDLVQLRNDIQELKDIEEIKRLRARYWELVDAQEWDAWGEEILTEDFWFHSDAGIHEGRDLVVETMRTALTGGKTVHHGHSPRVLITGADSATGVWPMNDYVTIPTPSGAEFVIRGYGYYHDEYRRTPDGWRLARCRMQRLRVDTQGELGA